MDLQENNSKNQSNIWTQAKRFKKYFKRMERNIFIKTKFETKSNYVANLSNNILKNNCY